MGVFDDLSLEIKKTIISGDYSNYYKIKELFDSVFNDIYLFRKDESVRKHLYNLSCTLHDIGDPVVIVLLKYLLESLEGLNGLKVMTNDKLEADVELEDVADFLKNDLIANASNGLNFLNHKKGSSSIGKKKLYIGLIGYFKYFLENGGEDDLMSALTSMVNIWELSLKNNRTHEFYIYFSSFLHKLHFFGENQKARDFSELVIILSHKDKVLHYSFYTRMANFSRQRNIIDALISANALLYGIKRRSCEYDIFLSKVLLELFILLRNFKLYPYAEKIREARGNLVVNDEYDLHQFDMAYFNMLLTSHSPDVFEKANEYLGHNDVMKFGKFSGIPWFSFLHNLFRLDFDEFKSHSNLSSLYELLCNDPEIINSPVINNIMLGLGDDVSKNKEIVIRHIKAIQKARNQHDVNYEVMAIRPLVINLLRNSIKANDVEGTLIAHALTADTSYTPICTDSFGFGTYQVSLLESDESKSIYDDYIGYIERIIDDSSEKQFIWIGCNDYFSYSVSLYKGDFEILKFDEFKRLDLIDWSKAEIDNYAFNDQPRINEILQSKEEYWHEETEGLLQRVPVLVGNVYSDALVVFRDILISSMPVNLIKNSDGIPLCEKCAIITPLTVSNYINSVEVTINTEMVKLWAPVENSDWAIQIAYSKISDEFTDQEMIRVDTLDPKCDSNKDVNIFISHGGNDDLHGFKSISTGSGLYVIDEGEIFGTGKIAVLFICHSGSSKASWYASKINSLVDKVLSLGYEAVIAPAWSYNVTLAGVWTSTFISALRNGNNIIQSNYMANVKVKERFVGIGAYAAMHVFGNHKLSC